MDEPVDAFIKPENRSEGMNPSGGESLTDVPGIATEAAVGTFGSLGDCGVSPLALPFFMFPRSKTTINVDKQNR